MVQALLKPLKQKLASDCLCHPGWLRESGVPVFTKYFCTGPPWTIGQVVSPATASSLLVRVPDGTTWHQHTDHEVVRSPLQKHRPQEDQQQRQSLPAYLGGDTCWSLLGTSWADVQCSAILKAGH